MFENLVIALVGLLIAPVVAFASQRNAFLQALLNGFVFTSIALLVLVEILPSALANAGPWAALAFILGALLPQALKGLTHPEDETELGSLAIWLGMFALLFHSTLDGVGLRVASSEHPELGMAIALHKLPVGLMIWWLLAPRFGRGKAMAGLLLLGLSTVAGYFVGAGSLEGASVYLLSALVGGTLLHVVTASHGPTSEKPHLVMETLGGAVGLAFLVWLSGSHAHAHEAAEHGLFGDRFLELALTTAPALLFGYILAGAVTALLPSVSSAWLKKGGSFGQASKGVLFGLPLPICSCGVVPVYQSLVKRGVPGAAAMAFLVATPELGIDSLLLSLPLLGAPLTGARLLAALVLALGVGVFVGSRVPTVEVTPIVSTAGAEKGFLARLKSGLGFSLVDVVDDTAPWILAGVAIAALVEPSGLAPLLAQLPPGADVVGAVLLGIPLYVCASGATPLAAALLLVGLSPGAALAFLLAGPASNVTTFGVLTQAHGRSIALLFAGVVFLISIGLGLLVNVFIPSVHPIMLGHGEGTVGLLEWAALGSVGLLFLASLLRRGPQAFLGEILRLGRANPGRQNKDGDKDNGDDDAGVAEASCCHGDCSSETLAG